MHAVFSENFIHAHSVSRQPTPHLFFVHPPELSVSSSSKPHVFLKLISHCILTHIVQLVLPISTWVWEHPPDIGDLAVATSHNKSESPFPRKHQLPVAPQLGDGASGQRWLSTGNITT